MAANVISGRGKLYKANSEKLISEVSYKIHEELTTEGTLNRWWGELAPTDSIRIEGGEEFVIELEDGRKGRCYLQRRANRALILVPLSRVFHIHGIGLLA